MTQLHVILLMLCLTQEASKTAAAGVGPNHFTLPRSKHATDDLGMPEDVLLDSIHDEQDRVIMQAQLNNLRDARRRKKIMDDAVTPVLSKDTFSVYDCGAPDAVHRPVSLLEPDSCNPIELTHTEPTNVSVQVLQTGSALTVTAYRCALTISREVSRCGYDSIHYGTIITVLDKPVHFTPQQCRNAQIGGTFVFEGQRINVTLNNEMVHSYYRYGRLDNSHNCDHTSFTSGGQYFSKSYELSIIRAIVTSVKGRYNPATGRIIFSNGLVGNYADRVVLDDAEGLFVWDTSSIQCSDKISEIYNGPASIYGKLNNTHMGQTGDLVMVAHEAESRYAGLVLKGHTRICGRTAFTTQLTGLSLIVLRPNDEKIAATYHHPDELVSTHIQANLGFVHLQRALHTDKRFAALQQLVCENERKILQTKLTLIASDSKSALLDTYGPGHALTRAGAVAYVTVCVPRMARVRTASNCTQEIPVHVSNYTAYADPLTFVLQPYPTVIPCDSITPVRWRIKSHWMCATPALAACVPPSALSPTSDDTTTLQDFTVGLGGGIFSDEQKADHKSFMELMNTRAAVVNDVTRNALWHAETSGKLDSFYSPSDLARLKNEIGHALIPFFAWMGDSWSVITGVLVLLALCKIILGMLIRMYVTYTSRGCGWWLLASVWHTAFLAIMLPWRILTSVTDDLTTQHPGRPGSSDGRPDGRSRPERSPLVVQSTDDDDAGPDGLGRFPHPQSSQYAQGSRLDSESEAEGKPGAASRGPRTNLSDSIAMVTNYIKTPKLRKRDRQGVADSRYKELNLQLEELRNAQLQMTTIVQQARNIATSEDQRPSAPPSSTMPPPAARPSTTTTKADKGLSK